MTNAINTKGLDHLVLRTEKPQEMILFYETVLGCKVERTVEIIGLYQLRAGTSLIDIVDTKGKLGKRGGPPPTADGLNLDHYCLRIDPWDEAAIRKQLEEHRIEAPKTDSRYGAEGFGPSIYIQDPDGNTVELKGPPETEFILDAR
ncbi:MAG: VOC family protein [Pseudomonadota bacterium]|mgnify:CR=1 FL=1|nr:VOC family protein [Pseudomonadota bacterium]|tara:strand:- start:123 stop:560 length:438 start_codon:yes stop_codon:yes gene_type:complete